MTGTAYAYEGKFTSKERDAETGLDWFEHRYLSSAQGRFTSPDPVFANVHRLFDPQQWNLYAYVRNNPLSLTGPSGLDFYETCGHSDSNGSTCQQVQNGSSKVWVQGTTNNNGQFTANRIANDANGNLVDTAHGNAAATRPSRNPVNAVLAFRLCVGATRRLLASPPPRRKAIIDG